MPMKMPPGLFITGTNTEVGKTYVAALIAAALRSQGLNVGVYKPAASGCRREAGRLVADDALQLWEAAGRPGDLELVCPQCFEAPLAPHLAAEAEGRTLDREQMLRGIEPWRERSDVVIVEGAGGLMSPMGPDLYVADLAEAFAYPLIVVSRNCLGTIHATLCTLIAAATFRQGLETAGVVLNHPTPSEDDRSTATNRAELEARCVPPLLAEVTYGATAFEPPVDWLAVAQSRGT